MIKTLARLIIFLATVALAIGWYLNGYIGNLWQQTHQAQTEIITVERGNSFHTVAQRALGLGEETRWWLRVWFKLHPEYAHLRQGTFKLNAQMSLAELSQLLRFGDEVQYQLTLIEGESFKQFWQRLNKIDGVRPSNLTEAELMAHLGVNESSIEGLLLPETYNFVNGTKAEVIVKRAYVDMQKVLQTLWETRDTSIPIKSPYEALILASIIEKETGVAHERGMIASVFVNRLNKGMRLQTDPTVIYGMGERYDGNIRRKDLREATPYNTYVIFGLPPTPIAMPGKEAIKAALQPDHGDFYYFVAKGGGEHYFSKTLAEHNRAVRKYILGK